MFLLVNYVPGHEKLAYSHKLYVGLSIDPFHVRENVSKLEDKTKEI